jgi:cytoplasmic iron level regulating protein YaaA (DUF328/UPF0246 family)
MIVLLNSSKTLNMENPTATRRHSIPEFIEEAEALVCSLRSLDYGGLAKLMGISSKLARLNADRYQQWRTPFDLKNAKQALLAFSGDVFAGFKTGAYTEEDFKFAQGHVRILSGLFGILRPLDLIQPYRLEMATRLSTPRGRDLYAFWGDRVSASLDRLIQTEKSAMLINLASAEYLKVINLKGLGISVVTPVFQEVHQGKSRTVVIYTKRARGMMCDEIIRKRMVEVEGLKRFDRGGYRFNSSRSSDTRLVFERIT